ncbi:MAG TPA: hypothetical protein VJN94_10920 [Candidatus Binataceae bacterium]|nr:hypothetical protein [Candidatus Binataceae bacterium]
MSLQDGPIAAIPAWLETIRGDAPVLLIAPHGGRAGPAARATLHPKVNDLETAEITRQIAHRIGATALINAAMDRNEIDCNRLAQLVERAPWLLELIADELSAMIGHHGHATVVLIHGWNIIEPRVDFGLGLREVAGRLLPPAGAQVSATDAFIHSRVNLLAERLRAAQIQPTFGLRYPGGAAQNLLQGFTPRHATAGPAQLRRLAGVAASGAIDALQLEMSVALRLPGEFRERAIAAISETFAPVDNSPATLPGRIPIIREPRPRAVKKVIASNAPPSRVGVEFYDPVVQIGGMVSFDFGPGAAGGRIMILFDRCRVALFTAEGKAKRDRDRISIGDLELIATTGGGLRFRGPTVSVDDGSAYLSVEHALATGCLDPATEVDLRLELDDGVVLPIGDVLTQLEAIFNEPRNSSGGNGALPRVAPLHATFGRLRGTISIKGATYHLDAVARVGASFTGLGVQKFVTRRMVWAGFQGTAGHDAFEARITDADDANIHRIARSLHAGQWNDCNLTEIRVEVASPPVPPESIGATASAASGDRLSITGRPGTFVTLSRPGPDGTRLHTLLGFAEYRMGELTGAGMYEFSRRVGLTADTQNGEELEQE